MSNFVTSIVESDVNLTYESILWCQMTLHPGSCHTVLKIAHYLTKI